MSRVVLHVVASVLSEQAAWLVMALTFSQTLVMAVLVRAGSESSMTFSLVSKSFNLSCFWMSRTAAYDNTPREPN